MILTTGREKNSWLKRYFPELFLFFLSLAAAYFIGWNNTDLLWSLWITSLVTGYVSIFRGMAPVSILSKYKLTFEDIKKFRELSTAKKLQAIIFVVISVPLSLFTVAFLSLHFLIFHLFGAYFLQTSFPHPDLTKILADASGGELHISIQIIKTLLMSYWIIVLEKLIFDYRTYWKTGSNQVTQDKDSGVDVFEFIKRPYLQVVRINVLIVLLIWLNQIEVNQFLIYVVIYSVFFFPLPKFRKALSS